MAKTQTAELELVIGDDNPDALAGPDFIENFQKIDDAFVADREILNVNLTTATGRAAALALVFGG
jgi:hypothetical protein